MPSPTTGRSPAGLRLVRHRGKWALVHDGRRFSTGIDAGPAEEPGAEQRRADAERKAREILVALNRPSAGLLTCAQILDAYLADMPLRASPKTPGEGTRAAKKAVLKFFSGHEPHEVTRDECRAYIAARRGEGRSDGTIRKELGVLAAALRWADRRTPAEFEMPPVPPARTRFLTREEVARLLEASPAHVKSFVHVALATGARREAILAMTWAAHVDFGALGGQGTLWPGFKAGGKGRAMPLPMTAAAREWLRQARQLATTPYVVEWGGGKVANIRKALSASYARAGIEGVEAPAHVLRHTAGAWMAEGGVPLLEIARRLGHSSVAVTERHYAHLCPDAMARSTAALEL